MLVSTMASQQEGPEFSSQVRRAFPCGLFMFSLWLRGFPPPSETCIPGLICSRCPQIKCTGLDLVPWRCTRAAHCCLEEVGSDAKNEFHCTLLCKCDKQSIFFVFFFYYWQLGKSWICSKKSNITLNYVILLHQSEIMSFSTLKLWFQIHFCDSLTCKGDSGSPATDTARLTGLI